jgi:hypothetical protein
MFTLIEISGLVIIIWQFYVQAQLLIGGLQGSFFSSY